VAAWTIRLDRLSPKQNPWGSPFAPEAASEVSTGFAPLGSSRYLVRANTLASRSLPTVAR
jgi:hypothetical protein